MRCSRYWHRGTHYCIRRHWETWCINVTNVYYQWQIAIPHKHPVINISTNSSVFDLFCITRGNMLKIMNAIKEEIPSLNVLFWPVYPAPGLSVSVFLITYCPVLSQWHLDTFQKFLLMVEIQPVARHTRQATLAHCHHTGPSSDLVTVTGVLLSNSIS